MKYLIAIVIIFSILSGESVFAGDCSVCLGRYLSKVNDAHRVSLKIGDSKKIYFNKPQKPPKIVVEKLDMNEKHQVRVFYDDQVVSSWYIDFKNLNCKMVCIWRSAGAWRMDPILSNKCVWPIE